MAYNLLECNREQMYLMPVSLKDWLPEGHLAWFILDAVKTIDLSKFYFKYRADGWGRAAYDPQMMVSLLLYAYCLGVRSSRQIERACEVDVAFRVITANQKPDYSTLCRFRSQNEEELGMLFTDVLRLCAEAGLVKAGVVALDGTKIKANASLSANRTQEYIEVEVKKMLAEAREKDEEEDRLFGKDSRGDEIPEELKDRNLRIVRLKECWERLLGEKEEKVQRQAEKIEKRKIEEEAMGHKKRGRKPKEVTKVLQEEAKTKANITDPDSRIMETRAGHIQGYNAQIVVDEGQIIIAADVAQEANDMHQLHPMIEKAQQELKAVGMKEEIKKGLADAGYWSEKNLVSSLPTDPEFLVATTKDWKQRKAMRERGAPRGRIPKQLSVRDRMERKLLTKSGSTLYKLRSQMVEPVFGQIKAVRGCNIFMRRGIEAVQNEWRLICATHNLLKLFRNKCALISSPHTLYTSISLLCAG
jgi:transposase